MQGDSCAGGGACRSCIFLSNEDNEAWRWVEGEEKTGRGRQGKGKTGRQRQDRKVKERREGEGKTGR